MAKLFMVLAGASPVERNIEQHDVYFGIGDTLADIVPGLQQFWPGVKLHIDAYREVVNVNGYKVTVVPAGERSVDSPAKLFFINLGGYKAGEFEEFHYKMIIAAEDKAEAINISKKTAFFKHMGFKGANSHVDDKYGIDVDDVFEIKDILSAELKERFKLLITRPEESLAEDQVELGYFKLSAFNNGGSA